MTTKEKEIFTTEEAAEILEHRSIRLTAAQWAKVDAAGLDGLRKLIDRWRINK